MAILDTAVAQDSSFVGGYALLVEVFGEGQLI